MTDVIRIVGLPGSGKTFLREAIAAAVGAVSLGIDDERVLLLCAHEAFPFGRDGLAWLVLRDRIRMADRAVVETAGTSVHETTLYAPGDRRLTVLCRADHGTRRLRLIERRRRDPRLARDTSYVDRLMTFPSVDLSPSIVFDTSGWSDPSLVIQRATEWLAQLPARAAA